jgi:hypothetical protein
MPADNRQQTAAINVGAVLLVAGAVLFIIARRLSRRWEYA